jgi:hypothetical protein
MSQDEMNQEKLTLGEFGLWLVIAVPDFEKRRECLKDWLKLWKISARSE